MPKFPDADAIRRVAFAYDVESDLRHLKGLRADGTAREFTAKEFASVVSWKANRVKNIAEDDESRIRECTRAAFAEARKVAVGALIWDPTRAGDEVTSAGMPVWTAIDILRRDRAKRTGLTGVQTRMASALLTCFDMQRFTVMDIRAWLALSRYGEIGATRGAVNDATRKLLAGSATPTQAQVVSTHLDRADTYVQYLQVCWGLSATAGVSLRTLDRFLFVLGGAVCDHEQFLENRRREGLDGEI